MNNKKLFAKNSLTGVIQKLLVAVLTFLTIPIFINLLGIESFGIFATIGVIGDLTRLTNVGFHIALIKFLSSQGKTRESSQDIMVAFTSMLLIMLVASTALIGFNDYIILKILNVSQEFIEDSRVLFNFLVIANALLFIGLPFSAVLESRKMIYKVSYLQLIYSFMYWGMMLLVLSLGYGLRTIGLMAFIAALIWFLLTFFVALKSWGTFNFSGFFQNYTKSLKKQLGYGIKIYFSGILGLFLEPLTKVLVANFFGVSFVGFLDIGLRVKNQLSRVIRTGLWPLFQYFSELSEFKKIALIVKDFQEKLVLLVILLNVILIFTARSLVTLWIGENIDIITMNLLIITICGLTRLAFEPNNLFLGVYKPSMLIVIQVMMIIFNLLPIVLFYRVIGYQAVYAGFLLSTAVYFFINLYSQKKFLGNYIYDNKKDLVKILSYTMLLMIIGQSFHFLAKNNYWVDLIVTPFILTFSAVLVIKWLKLLSKDDIERYLGSYPISKNIKQFFNH